VSGGVEPASEDVTGQETTCLFDSCSRFTGNVRGARSERTETRSASLMISPTRSRRNAQASPLFDVPIAAHGEAAKDGYLIN